MIKIEAETLEEAYKQASEMLQCSITEISVEIVQNPSPGVFGFFKKKAIIVASRSGILNDVIAPKTKIKARHEEKTRRETDHRRSQRATRGERTYRDERAHHEETHEEKMRPNRRKKVNAHEERAPQKATHKRRRSELNNTIIPQSFVHDQEEDFYEDEIEKKVPYTADYDDAYDNNALTTLDDIAYTIEEELNDLFDLSCFDIEKILVSVYDDETVMIDFKGADAALLIGKEGYRYKALSYMLFNWINSKYNLQVRLEIAEFLKNQEEAVDRYLVNVYETIEKDGRAQTKILDGVLVQIALQKLRDAYPDKYVVIRSTKDGLKYIVVNEYHNS